MFCLRGSSQRVVEPVLASSMPQTQAQKPSLGDINLNHEIFRRKSMIANPNVQLVKIKTVAAFRNARKGMGPEGAETNGHLPSLDEQTRSQPQEGSCNQPQTSTIKRRFTMADVARKVANGGTKKVSFQDFGEDEPENTSQKEGGNLERKASVFKKIAFKLSKRWIISNPIFLFNVVFYNRLYTKSFFFFSIHGKVREVSGIYSVHCRSFCFKFLTFNFPVKR